MHKIGHIKRLQQAKATSEKTTTKVAFKEQMKIKEDQTRFFAEASNDPNPVHLDENFARAAGLPGIIVHGLCSMAFCSRAFVQQVCKGDPSRLAVLKVRFSKPAQPGQTLTTIAYSPQTEEDGEKVYGEH